MNVDLNFLWDTKLADNLVLLLKSNYREVLHNAVWALANITGDSLDYRNRLLNSNLVDSLINIIKRLKNKQDPIYDKTALDGATWLASNLCRGKPYPPYDEVIYILSLFFFFLFML